MAAKSTARPGYNPLWDGIDAAAETLARRKCRKKTVPNNGSFNSGEKVASTAVCNEPAAPTVIEKSVADVQLPTPPMQPARQPLPAASREPTAAVETVGDVVPAGRRYRLEPPSAADLATPQLYVARDLRSVEFPGWLAAYFPAGGEIDSRPTDPATGQPDERETRVTRLTAEIWADIDRQCRQIWEESRGRWHLPDVRERVLRMLDRYAVVREWARRQGWKVED